MVTNHICSIQVGIPHHQTVIKEMCDASLKKAKSLSNFPGWLAQVAGISVTIGESGVCGTWIPKWLFGAYISYNLSGIYPWVIKNIM